MPTRRTAAPFGADRLGAIVVTPNPALFPPPWPAAVYGPGFTRSKYDIFVTADYNAARGIVTVATDPVRSRLRAAEHDDGDEQRGPDDLPRATAADATSTATARSATA